jgi:CBS domain containing-hemolysin-like protein
MSATNENRKDESYDAKKGVGFGAFAGFVAAVAFTGIVMWLPVALGMPTGLFLHALGLSIAGTVNDPVFTGMAAFAIILVMGISIGILFGIITARSPRLHTSNKKRGVGFGVIAGIIAYLVLYLPMILTIYPQLLTNAVITYPFVKLSLFGESEFQLTTTMSAYLSATLGIGIIAYLAYGAIMGGIVALEYSIYDYSLNRRKEEEKEEEKEQHKQSGSQQKSSG